MEEQEDHEYTICKHPNPDIGDCKWQDYTHDHLGRKLEQTGWQRCTDGWCNTCSVGYHKVCDHLINKVEELFNVRIDISDDFSLLLKSLIDEAIRKSNMRGMDKSDISKEEKKIDAYRFALSKCSSYRRNHHKHCVRNIYDASERKGDPGHKKVIDRLNQLSLTAKKGITDIRKIKYKTKSPILRNKPRSYSHFITSSYPRNKRRQ